MTYTTAKWALRKTFINGSTLSQALGVSSPFLPGGSWVDRVFNTVEMTEPALERPLTPTQLRQLFFLQVIRWFLSFLA